MRCLAIARACDEWEYEVVRAIHILSHEASHLGGVSEESKAECYAIQRDAATAVRFGATNEAAQALAASALSANTTSPTTNPHRLTRDCAPRGQLDLHPETAAWPSW